MTEWIKLNVGGQTFLTTKLTLLSEPDSMLAKMFSGEFAPGAKDDQGAYMIDGNPKYFEPILDYLRRRELVINPNISKDGVLVEAQYFGIQSLVDQIEKIPEAKRVTTLRELHEIFDLPDKIIQKFLSTTCQRVVICGHDGNIWAKSADFVVSFISFLYILLLFLSIFWKKPAGRLQPPPGQFGTFFGRRRWLCF